MTWGLVLAGGGVTGLAWEAGVVVGLRASGVDVTSADVAIGTSAGSIVGSLLFSGLKTDELAALVSDPARPPLVLEGKPKNDGNPARNLEVFSRWMTAGPMTAKVAAEISAISAGARTMTEEAWVEAFDEVFGALPWSPRLQIVSVDVESGDRKLWTSADEAPLARVVASSCAVPGTFPAVAVNGRNYLDGGLWSPISADLLLGRGLDAVLVVSPLGGDDPIGKAFTSSVATELDQLEADGAAIELLTPEVPISPLAAFDESQRVHYFELGRAEGQAAADRVRALLGEAAIA